MDVVDLEHGPSAPNHHAHPHLDETVSTVLWQEMAQRSTLPQAAAAGDLNGVIAILEKAAAEKDALDQKRAEAGLRPHPLPPGWTAHRGCDNRKYYHHAASKATTRERPPLRVNETDRDYCARGTRGCPGTPRRH